MYQNEKNLSNPILNKLKIDEKGRHVIFSMVAKTRNLFSYEFNILNVQWPLKLDLINRIVFKKIFVTLPFFSILFYHIEHSNITMKIIICVVTLDKLYSLNITHFVIFFYDVARIDHWNEILKKLHGDKHKLIYGNDDANDTLIWLVSDFFFGSTLIIKWNCNLISWISIIIWIFANWIEYKQQQQQKNVYISNKFLLHCMILIGTCDHWNKINSISGWLGIKQQCYPFHRI